MKLKGLGRLDFPFFSVLCFVPKVVVATQRLIDGPFSIGSVRLTAHSHRPGRVTAAPYNNADTPTRS